MKKNMGGTDRILRAVAGIGMIVAGIYYQSWWGAVGAIPLFTSVLGWCPLYCPLNLSTKKD